MPEPIKINLEFDFGHNGGKWIFSTLEDCEKWWQEECARWNWLQQAMQKDGEVGRVWQTQEASRNDVRERFNRIRQTMGRPENEQRVKELVSVLQRVYSEGKVIHTASSAGRHVLAIAQTDPILAGHTLAFYLRLPLSGNPIAHRGAFTAMLQETGLLGAAAAERKALEEMRLGWQAFREESRSAFGAFQDAFQKVTKSGEKQVADQAAEFQRLVTECNDKMGKLLTQAKESLSAVEKTYDEKLSLQASVTYWKIKAKGHMRQSIGYAVAAFVAMAAVSIGLHRTIELVGGATKLAETELWKVGLLAIVATVGVWFIRVLVRLLLSHVHLHTDAVERRTMLLTYLALLRKNKIPEGDERRLILQALFRPASAGIIKDDASPPFMAEWLKRTTGTD